MLFSYLKRQLDQNYTNRAPLYDEVQVLEKETTIMNEKVAYDVHWKCH